MTYYVKDYELEFVPRDGVVEGVREHASEGSDAEHMVEVMDELSEDYKLFEVSGLGSPNVFVPREEPASMGSLIQSGEPVETVTIYTFEWGARGDRNTTVFFADDNDQARKIGGNVVKALAHLTGSEPECPKINPGNFRPDTPEEE